MIKIKEKINALDFLLMVSIIFSLTGYLLAKGENHPLNKVIQDKEKIAIEILLPEVYSDKDSFFKIGEKAAITIRNRPYTKLSIINSKERTKQTLLPQPAGNYKIINDPTKENFKDYILTLSDIALKTSDGYVIGGNKIKAGNQVELEGFNYRLNGKIINIYPLKE